jgi:hypothetical protein
MSDPMTMAEIEAAFPSEWVLLSNPQTDPSQGILGGQVIHHSKDRDEVDEQASTLPVPRHFAVVYTGPIPERGKAIIL